MVLSKKIHVNSDLKIPTLVVVAVIITIEFLLGLLSLLTGLHIFLLFFGGLLAVLIFLFPKIGAILMLFFMPGVEYLDFDIGSVTINPLRILLVPTFIGLALHIVVNKSAIRMGTLGAPIVALIAIAVLSILQSSNLGAGLIRLTFFLSLFLITFVLAQLIDDKKWVKIAVGVMVGSSVILTTLILTEAYLVYKGMPGIVGGGPRLAAGISGRLYETSHPLTLDLNTYLPFVLLLAVASTRWKSLLLILLVCCFILGIVLAAAMAGWLATIGALVVLVVIGLARKQDRAVRGVLKRLALVILFGLIVVPIAVPTGMLGERIKRFLSIVTLHDIRTQRTSEVRIPVWIAAKRMFYDHPILGVGLGSMPIEYRNYMVAEVGLPGKEFTHHGFNVFVDIGTEMGILGIGAFVWFMIACARHVVRHLGLIEDPFLANMLLACSAACVAVFVQMQTETGPFWANNFWCLLGLSLAIINVGKASGSDRHTLLSRLGETDSSLK